MAQKLFGDFPANVSSQPGMVTPNMTADIQQNVDWGAINGVLAQRRARGIASQNARLRQQNASKMAAQQENKIRSAYEKIYAPMAQSQWDMSQGQIGGVNPRRVGGQPGAGQAVYQQKDPWGLPTGRYNYRPDTNMPAGMYQQGLENQYQMWKAMKMLGFDKEQYRGGMPAVPGARAQGFGPRGGG